MSNNSRLVPVPARSRSAHAVFTSEPGEKDANIEVPSAALLRHFGSSRTSIERLAQRTFGSLFLTEVPTAEAASAAVDARRRALTLAEERDGVVVDLTVPRTVEHRAADTDAAVASHWVAMELDHLVLRSRGLEAFGLPELVLDAANSHQTPMVLGVAMGVAHRLITEWPTVDPVGPAEITLRDIANAYGDPDAATSPTKPTAKLLISYTDGHLAVTLTSDPAELFDQASDSPGAADTQ